MTRFDRLSAGLGLCGLALLAPAGASTTGHVGVFSEYVFRGIVANGGAAVQGGIDHFHDSGLLGGVWATNTTGFGGSEFDVYVGYLRRRFAGMAGAPVIATVRGVGFRLAVPT